MMYFLCFYKDLLLLPLALELLYLFSKRVEDIQCMLGSY
jgi:hypothetical protein